MPSSLRSIFSRQKGEQSSTSVQNSTESWSLERYRREYENLTLEMETVRQMAHIERQAYYAAEHDIISSRSILIEVREAFKDIENDLANSIDIDHCRRVVWESDVPSYATTEVHNELKKLRVIVNELKSRVKDLAAGIQEHLK
jgi:hypothetical protein